MKKNSPIVNSIFFNWFIAVSMILLAPRNSFGHKVNIFAYAEGQMVYTESYFPDGSKVVGGVVEVYDSQGNNLLSGKTDHLGQFNFPIPKKDDLKIVIIAGMGHKNSYLLSADELPDIIEQEKKLAQETIKGQETRKDQEITKDSPLQKSDVVQTVNLDEFKKIIDQSLDEKLDQKLSPILRKLAKSENEKISPTEIFGGIGYIFGIVGLILYFTKRNN